MEDNETSTDPKVDEATEVITEVKDDLKGEVSLAHLKDLEDRLKVEIHSVVTDKSKTDHEKAELEGKLEKLEERIQELITAQEEKDRKHNDETTIVVPPKELDPPTHQNQPVEAKENVQTTPRKKRLPWW